MTIQMTMTAESGVRSTTTTVSAHNTGKKRRGMDLPHVLSVILMAVFALQSLWLGSIILRECREGGGQHLEARRQRRHSNRRKEYRVLEAYDRVRAAKKRREEATTVAETTASATTTMTTTTTTNGEQLIHHSETNDDRVSITGSEQTLAATIQDRHQHQNNASTSTIPQRIFPKWTRPFPCAAWEGSFKRGETTEGFLYLKEIKTGSSTMAGITMRIARNVANRSGYAEACRSRFVHNRARKYERRLRDRSFLWTVLRSPTHRLWSKFFHFGVSRDGIVPSAANLRAYLEGYSVWIVDHAYYLKTMTLRDINPRDVSKYRNYTQMLLDDYDFIGVSERVDESLAVLQLLLGLDTGDMLYLSTKSEGSFEYLPHQGECNRLVPKFLTPDMRTLMEESKFWKDYTEADTMIYEAVDRSLDLTIGALGKDIVQREVEKLRFAQSIVARHCEQRAVFPCDADGVDHRNETNCLFGDSGCGYECLDEVAALLPRLKTYRSLTTEAVE